MEITQDSGLQSLPPEKMFAFFHQTAMGIGGPVGVLWAPLSTCRAEVSWVSAPVEPACHQSTLLQAVALGGSDPPLDGPWNPCFPLTWGNCQNGLSYSQSPLKDAPMEKRPPNTELASLDFLCDDGSIILLCFLSFQISSEQILKICRSTDGPEMIMQREISQSEQDKYHMTSFIYEI